MKATRSSAASAASFTDDVVGPFHQGYVDRDRAPLRVPTAQVRLRDPTGPGAGSSRKYRDTFGYHLGHGLAQGRPSDRFDRVNRHLAHEIRSVVSEKNLHVMPGVGQCKPVGKNEGCASRIIGPPRTPHQNVQFLLGCLTLLSLRPVGGGGNCPCGERADSQLRRFFKKLSAVCDTPPPAIASILHEPGADYKLWRISVLPFPTIELYALRGRCQPQPHQPHTATLMVPPGNRRRALGMESSGVLTARLRDFWDISPSYACRPGSS